MSVLQFPSSPDAPIDPEQRAMIERVLKAQCQLRGISIASADAWTLAEWLILLFQRGIRTEAQLMATMSQSHGA